MTSARNGHGTDPGDTIIETGFARATTSIRKYSTLLTAVFAALTLAFFAVSLSMLALDRHPLSVIDEHVHFDYAIKLHEGEIPHRGAVYGEGLLDEWSCGVGHQVGQLGQECGDLTVPELPTGKYTTGYIHYPTYFAGAEAFRWAVESTLGSRDPISVYRLFSALALVSGAIASLGMGLTLGMRGFRLLAATFVPVAASSIWILSVAVNPGSTAVLSGTLIAGAGLNWMIRGKGFGWLVGAAAFAASIAVTNSLPTGAFLLAILVAIVAQRFGWTMASPWKPKLRHLFILAGVILAPIIIWGRVIEANATIPNSALYSFATPSGWQQVFVGVMTELFAFHSPWIDVPELASTSGFTLPQLLRGIASGLPFWLTIIVVGAVVVALLQGKSRQDAILIREEFPERQRTINPAVLLALCALATIILYPPALRFSNSLTFGFDFGIVSRYSIAFTPLFTYLALLLWPRQRFGAVLAIVGVLGVVGLSAAAH